MDFHLNNHVICTLEYFSSSHQCLGTSVSCGKNFNFLLRCLYDFLRYFYHLGLCQKTGAKFVDANLLCHQWTLWGGRNCGILPDEDFIILFIDVFQSYPSLSLQKGTYRLTVCVRFS